MPFEIHIDKRTFEYVFGHGTGPQKEDTIYFSINDRMYDVQSSTLFRDFMAVPIYWKLSLIKHENKSHIIKMPCVDKFIFTFNLFFTQIVKF